MAKIDSGLGWQCDEEYFMDSVGIIATVDGRVFRKTVAGACIVVNACPLQSASGPIVLSTVQSYAQYDQGDTTSTEACTYLGETWYMTAYNYWFGGTKNNTNGVALDVNLSAYSTSQSQREAVALHILNLAGVTTNPTEPYYTVVFNDGNDNTIEQDILCGVQTALEPNTFTKANFIFKGWDISSSATTVVYADEEDVTDIAQEGETITLYAVWEPVKGFLIGDGSGDVYTQVVTGVSDINFVEYIESTGTQYIDTGYICTNNTKAVLSCNLSTTKPSYATPFGVRRASNSQSFLVFTSFGGSTTLVCDYGSGEGSVGSISSLYGVDSTITLQPGYCEMTDGTTTVSKTFTSGLPSSVYSLYLFTLNEGGRDYGSACHCYMKLYSFKLYEGNNLMMDLRPALDDSDVPCLYDMISEQYLYNAGSGTFTAGNPIVVPGSFSLEKIPGLTTSALTKSAFTTHGFLEQPQSDLLCTLASPKVYFWDSTSSAIELSAEVSATPVPQPIVTHIDFTPVHITGIKALSAVYDLGESGTITVEYSYDGTNYTSAGTIAQFLVIDKDTLYNGINDYLYLKFTLSEDATLTSFKLDFKRRSFAP